MIYINSRKIAVEVLIEVLNKDKYNNIVLKNKLDNNELSRIDKAFITQIVNGSLRNLIYIDYVIRKFVKIRLKKMDDIILNIIRVGVYQILFMDKVPDSAACNEAVKLSKVYRKVRLSGYVNGVLRNIVRSKDKLDLPNKENNYKKYIMVKYSYPEWIIDLWNNYSYSQIENICMNSNIKPYVNICVNTNKISKEELKQRLLEKDIEVIDGVYSENNLKLKKVDNISLLEEFKKGMFHIQDESSMLAVECIGDIQKNAMVLDLCSAPGGKSFYASILLDNDVNILARDIFDHKLSLIKDGVKRLNLDNIVIEKKDATVLDDNMIDKCDVVILDAPCSGLGIIRKKPDIKYKKNIKNIEEIIKLQRQIIDNAVMYLKQGGILIYSTCTINEMENENNVDYILGKYDFKVCDISNYIKDDIYNDTCKKGYVQILPNDKNIDGFFISKFIKN